jgi:DNA-binding winged helix-turn-helix (wHTH) protein
MDGSYRFGSFRLDPAERLLSRSGEPVEINARYLDALTLLVREQGKLVSKDRFMAEVWRGIPVTDEALTQCVRTLRRQLGDDAANPRFIETVPKHGYRFIAAVETDEAPAPPPAPEPAPAPALDAVPAPASREPGASWHRFFITGGAGTAGAGVAGMIGGLLYGFGGAPNGVQPGPGAVSVLLVLLCLTIFVALLGGAGVAFGIAAGGFAKGPRWQWSIAGGAAGGMIVGAFVKLLGLDAFNLLFGRSPGDVTGAPEGALLGAAAGLAAWLGSRGDGTPSLRRGTFIAALCGAGAGLLIALLGGRLLGGSLALVAGQFPDSRLRLDQMGALFGESGFGPVTTTVTGALEGLLFAACTVGGMMLARRKLEPRRG